MEVTLDLNPEMGERLKRKAAERGLSVEAFLETLITADISRVQEKAVVELASHEEWKNALRNWIKSFPLHPILPKDAISREGIYREREDAQL